jgi:hypothetical protein
MSMSSPSPGEARHTGSGLRALARAGRVAVDVDERCSYGRAIVLAFLRTNT